MNSLDWYRYCAICNMIYTIKVIGSVHNSSCPCCNRMNSTPYGVSNTNLDYLLTPLTCDNKICGQKDKEILAVKVSSLTAQQLLLFNIFV